MPNTDQNNTFLIPLSAQKWLMMGARGVSSETIFGAITGLWVNKSKSPPADPADFYKCYALIQQVPQWKDELYKVAAVSDVWKNIVENWDTLSRFLEVQIEMEQKGISCDSSMYRFMKSLGC